MVLFFTPLLLPRPSLSLSLSLSFQKSDDSIYSSVIGSGSFGHFQASKSGVHKGGLDQPLVKAGFVATRISVRFSALTFLFFLMFFS